MWRKSIPLLLSSAALVVLAACGGSSTNDSANYVAVPTQAASSGSIQGAGSSVGITNATPLGDAAVTLGDANVTVTTTTKPTIDVPADLLEQVTETYDEFLAIRAGVIVRTAEQDMLTDFATSTAIDQIVELRSINDAYLDDEAIIAMTDLMEWSNINGATASGDQIILTDCTERQYITRLGARRIAFATNTVTLVAAGDSYQVANVIEHQNGAFATTVGEMGCVPTSFVERADTAVTTAIGEIAELVADPAARRGMSDILAPELAQAVAAMVGDLDVNNLSRVSDETFELSVMGMDLGKPEFTVVIAMCTYYPTGYFYVTSTGQPTAPEILPGSSELTHVYVQLDAGVGAEGGDAVTSIRPQNESC